MTVKHSTGLRAAMLGGTGLGGALNRGVIYLYTGSQPATADSPATGTLLGVVSESGLAFVAGVADNGLQMTVTGARISKTATRWEYTGLAAGNIGWARFVGNPVDSGLTSTTLARLDMAVGITGADLNLSNIAVVVGTPGSVSEFYYELPAE